MVFHHKLLRHIEQENFLLCEELPRKRFQPSGRRERCVTNCFSMETTLLQFRIHTVTDILQQLLEAPNAVPLDDA